MSGEPDGGSPRSGSPSFTARLARAVRAFRVTDEPDRFGRPERSAASIAAAERGGKAGGNETGGSGAERGEAARRGLIARMNRAHLSGELAERVTHEISNHLQVVLGNAELLALAATLSDDARRQLAWITEAGRAAAAANGALRELSLGEGETPEGLVGVPPSLGEVLARTAQQLDRLASPAHLDTAAVDADARAVRLSAAAPPDLLGELLLRLVRHARLAPGDTAVLHAALLPPPPDVASVGAEAPQGKRPARRLRLGVRIGAPPGTAPPTARASAAPRPETEPSAAETSSPGETLSTDILAALAELAGGRLDTAVDVGGSAPSPADLVLPVERAASKL